MPLTRREFLAYGGLTTLALAGGCAVNPVTGRKQLMLVSEDDEIRLDRQNSPHQFSADYGPVQDQALINYVASVGRSLARGSHRPGMPYRFVPINAAYVNAYTFPAGSVGITRGILANLSSEAELASLIGHELGHVNARHTAQSMSKGVLASVLVSGVAAAAGDGEQTEKLAAGLGSVAAGALLARYSRDNEREADDLGMRYMVMAGYDPAGQVALMDMLRGLSKKKPGVIELMFATHPMSEERYQTSVKKAASLSQDNPNLVKGSERYMDNTAALRALKPLLERMQDGEKAMGAGRWQEAEEHLAEALRLSPGDYAALLMMAKCQLAQEKGGMGAEYARQATEAYPGEPQALHVLGMADLALNRFGKAYERFLAYSKALPGNPNTVFFMGYSAERMDNRDLAARHYTGYLKEVREGEKAKYAAARLKEWGYGN